MVASDQPLSGLMALKLAKPGESSSAEQGFQGVDRQSVSSQDETHHHAKARENGVSSLHGAKAACRHAVTGLTPLLAVCWPLLTRHA